MRAIRRRSCENKRRYDSESDAMHAARVSIKVYGVYRVVYKCKFGNHFHIGRPDWKAKARIKSLRQNNI